MAKSSKKKKIKPSSETKRRVSQFAKSDEFRKVRAVFYLLLAVFWLVAMVSYFLQGGTSVNWCGGAGYWFADLLCKKTFGIAAPGYCFLLFVYAMKLLHRDVLPWWRTLLCTLFWMMWLSCVMGYVNIVATSDLSIYSGTVGYEISYWLYGGLRIGLPVLLLFVGCAFLFLVHHVKMPSLHLPKRASEAESEGSTEEEYDPQVVAIDPTEPSEPWFRKLFTRRAKSQDKEPDVSTVDESQDGPKPVTGAHLSAVPPVEKEPAADREEEQKKTEQAVEFAITGEEAAEVQSQTETIEFDIDDALEKVNARAKERAAAVDDVPLEITETGSTMQGESQQATAEQASAEESLADDDYRKFYGLDDPYDPRLDLKDFQMPTTDILEDWEQRNVKVSREELVANKDRIVETLRNYGIEITGITASPGPTVTLYEIKPAPGVRISRIKTLEDDIALSLSALGIRIVAPIPGKGTVGIEVPNANPQIVSMRTMLTSDAFVENSKFELPIAFGKTISNEPFVTDLAKMPHLLMAGATGTGKSVGLNAVIASLLYKKHPAELKFVMVDPKKVELSLYNKIERHYLAKLPDSDEAIITDVKKVVRTLNSLCIEMDQRYDLLKQAQVRKITEYNDKFIKRHLNPNNGHRYLPYIVLVIDEFADLIMTAGKEIEAPICRLAQLARAVGIHLIIATQRPTTNIITGTIKANFPARIAFRVTSAIDSRTILDCGGANQLIGRGDMLISLAGSELIRCQCALIETEEIERLADSIGQQRGYAEGEGFMLPEYLDENEEPNKDFDPKQKDEFFNDAARLVVSSQFGSTSLLQRKLQLGYNRAGRIIDQMEAAGIVGPYNGSKAREVLIKDEATLEELLRSL
ncbi:MAG: DNA translocase FtsK [Bacteroidales bacterium]|nr:DNA translocase FtsK [Bacteroidales bacterium]